MNAEITSRTVCSLAANITAISGADRPCNDAKIMPARRNRTRSFAVLATLTIGGPNAPRKSEQGVDTPVWLATLPDDGPTGGFFYERKPLDGDARRQNLAAGTPARMRPQEDVGLRVRRGSATAPQTRLERAGIGDSGTLVLT